jgi:hypothetical protein
VKMPSTKDDGTVKWFADQHLVFTERAEVAQSEEAAAAFAQAAGLFAIASELRALRRGGGV